VSWLVYKDPEDQLLVFIIPWSTPYAIPIFKGVILCYVAGGSIFDDKKVELSHREVATKKI
jgi:hypothetical protein